MSEKIPAAESEKHEIVGSFGVNQYLGKKLVKGPKGLEPVEKKMEDAWVAEKKVAEGKFFAVYDGHGGGEGSKLAAQKLHELFSDHLKRGLNSREAIREAFLNMDVEIENVSNAPGTTAVIVFFEGNKLLVANAGDARAIMVKEVGVERLSHDHKIKDPEEMERIVKAGGEVVDLGGHLYLEVARAGSASRINLSRSLGDARFGALVSPEPEIREVEIGPEDKKVVLASDGLWDYLSDKEAADLIRNEPDADRASNILCDEIIKRGRDKRYVDNVTALVINLNG